MRRRAGRVAALLLLAGCAGAGGPGQNGIRGDNAVATPAPVTERVIEEVPGPRPGWVDRIPDATGQALYFVGQSGSQTLERDARNDALRDAVNAFARYCGVDVSLVDEYLTVGVSKASGVADPTLIQRSQGRQSAEAFVSRVKGQEWYSRRIERSMGPTVLERGWQAWVLVTVPPDEVDRVREYQAARRAAEAEGRAAPFLEPYGRAEGLLAAARRSRDEGHPLDALATYLEALALYEETVGKPGFDQAQGVLRAKGHEFPLPVSGEIQELLARLRLEAASRAPRLEPGEALAEPLRVRAFDGTKPLAGAPVLFAGPEGDAVLTTGADGAVAYHPEHSTSWVEGNRLYQARLSHPALDRAAGRFAVPAGVSFPVEVRPLSAREAEEHNRSALDAMAGTLAERLAGAPGLRRIAVPAVVEGEGPTRLGPALAEAVGAALSRQGRFAVVDSRELEALLGAQTGGASSGALDGVLVSRAEVTGEQIQLTARVIRLDTTAVAATCQGNLRLTPAWRAARGTVAPATPAVDLDARFRYQVPNALPRPLEDGMTLRSGHRYSIYFEPRQAAYVYVYQIDSQGRIYPFFPNPDFSGLGNPVAAGQAVWLPSEDWSFELDDHPGTEELYVVASRVPLREVEGVFTRLRETQDLGPEQAGATGAGSGPARRTLTLEASRETLEVAMDLLASPSLGTVKKVKFLHK